MSFSKFKFQREREGLREWLPLLRCEVLLVGGFDRVARCGSNDGQVSKYFTV